MITRDFITLLTALNGFNWDCYKDLNPKKGFTYAIKFSPDKTFIEHNYKLMATIIMYADIVFC